MTGPAGEGFKPRIGLSACLAGRNVRHDGEDKFNERLMRMLNEEAEPVLICPEVAIGLGVPRPAIKLSGPPENPKAVAGGNGGVDLTGRLSACGAGFIMANRICGFIGKGKSPSCGHRSAEVYDGEVLAGASGSGIFIHAITHAAPGMPVEDAERLADKAAFEGFMTRVLGYAGLVGKKSGDVRS